MILNSFIHITGTERNITPKILESCNKKYLAHHRCSRNCGNTICTTDKVTTPLHEFSQAI